MPALDQIAATIIKEQERVIGPLAWTEAKKVRGLQISAEQKIAVDTGDARGTIDRLVAQYERLFGRASHEVCKEAASKLIAGLAPAEVPASLIA